MPSVFPVSTVVFWVDLVIDVCSSFEILDGNDTSGLVI